LQPARRYPVRISGTSVDYWPVTAKLGEVHHPVVLILILAKTLTLTLTLTLLLTLTNPNPNTNLKLLQERGYTQE